MQRSADRRAATRPEPTHRQPSEPQTTNAEPTSAPQSQLVAPPRRAPNDKPPRKRLGVIVATIIGVIVLAAIGWFAWSAMNNTTGAAIDDNKYQAVFFTNGQVYFGKLQPFNDDYMKLTDIYYLQSQQSSTDTAGSENPQETSTDQNNVQLIKLGDEIHGPEDKMVISKDQILFFENLTPDGKVSQSIQSFQNTNE